MEQLLNLTTDAQGASVVSARELYEFLGFNMTHWAKWSKNNITGNSFAIECIDWQLVEGTEPVFAQSAKTSKGGRPSADYALSLEFAERLCMLARTEKGEEVRRWFQAIRDKVLQLRQSANAASLDKPAADLLQRQGQLLEEQHKAIAQLREQVDELMSGQRPARSQAPVSLCRQSVVRRVNRYAQTSDVSTKEVYTWLYNRLQQVYGIDLRSLPRRTGESLLDVADRYDYLHRLLGLIEAELNYIEE